MKRIFVSFLITLGLLLVVTTATLYSHSGNRLIWQLATNNLPELKGEFIQGSFRQGWQFKSLSWHGEAMIIDIQALFLSWQPSRILRGELIIDEVIADSIKMVDLSINEEKETKADRSAIVIPAFEMPLSLELKQLDIRSLEYSQGDNTQLLESLTLSAHAEHQQLTIRQFELNQGAGNVHLEGQLGWQDGFNWQGALSFKEINPEQWFSDYPGVLSGHLSTTAFYNKDQWHLSINPANISGELRHFPVTVTGSLGVNSEEKITANNLSLKMGQNRLQLNGQLEQDWTLTGLIDAPELTAVYPQLNGNLSGDFKLSGSRQSPRFDYKLSSDRLALGDVELSGLFSSGTITNLQTAEGRASITLENLLLDKQPLENIQLSLAGNKQQHRLSVHTGGIVTSDLQVEGSLDNQHWQGQVSALNLSSLLGDWNLQKAFSLKVTQENVQSSPFCVDSRPTTLCFGEGMAEQHNARIDFDLQQLDLARFTPLFPERFVWRSALNASGNIVFSDGNPLATIKINTGAGRFGSASLLADYETLQIDASIDGNQFKAGLDFLSRELGNARLDLDVSDINQSRKLNGQLTINELMLNPFQPLIPDTQHLNGIVTADLQLKGSVENPLLEGKVVVDKAALDNEICQISDMTTQLLMTGSASTISSQLKVGGGSAEVAGSMSWHGGEIEGQIKLTGQELYCEFGGIAHVWSSPDLTLTLDEPPLLSGTLSIPKTRIKVKSLPEQAITSSDDVRIMGADDQEEPQGTQQLALNATIFLGSDVRLSAYGLTSRLTGKLTLSQTGEQPLSGQGVISLSGGRYRYLGQDLVIKEGQFLFQGPLDSPFFTVNAQRHPDATADRVKVGVKVSGSMHAPNWSVYSTPNMPQQEQLSYLVRGRGMQSSSNDGMQSALLGLGLSELGSSTTELGDRVGIKDFSIDTTGQGKDTQVSVGGYIAPGLKMQYGSGVFSSVSEVKIRYEFFPRVYLQVISGLGQALDVFYRFSF